MLDSLPMIVRSDGESDEACAVALGARLRREGRGAGGGAGGVALADLDNPGISLGAGGSSAHPEQRARAESFLLSLGEALHRQGLPADRLEEALSACARRLGLEAQLFCTPTSFFASFGSRAEASTHLVRVVPGEVDLGRLADLSEVIDAVVAGSLSPAVAEHRLLRVAAQPPRWGRWSHLLAFGLACASAACFLGGGMGDVLVAWGAGSAIGVLAALVSRRPGPARVFEPLAAVVASCLALVLSPDGRADLATLAALIVLVPGFTLTVALSELATRHLAAGTARLAGALVTFLTIGFGVALGRRLGEGLPRLGPLSAAPLPEWALPAALLCAPLAFLVLFGARRRDAPWVVASGVLAYLSARAGVAWLGPELGGFVGAFAVGTGSNLLARHTPRPALVTLVPGIMLLVPGSIGFQSVSSFLAQDALSGVEAGFRMGLVAVSLVAGLLLAHALVPPRRAL